jgi:isopentenyl phosphate kinase
MLQLHSLVLEQLNSKEIFCGTILPSELVSPDGKKITTMGFSRIGSTIDFGLIPISFGSVLIHAGRSRVISGDEITLALTRRYRVKKVIFAMDVDGIYPDSKLDGEVLSSVSSNQKIDWLLPEYDVTGGVEKKIRTGFQLSRAGAEVFFVNGSIEGRLYSILDDRKDVISTKIFSKRHLR